MPHCAIANVWYGLVQRRTKPNTSGGQAVAGHSWTSGGQSATFSYYCHICLSFISTIQICSGIIIFQIHSITFHIFSLCQTNMSNQNTFNCIYHFRIRALQDRQQQITRDKTQPGYLLSHCSRDTTSKTHLWRLWFMTCPPHPSNTSADALAGEGCFVCHWISHIWLYMSKLQHGGKTTPKALKWPSSPPPHGPSLENILSFLAGPK